MNQHAKTLFRPVRQSLSFVILVGLCFGTTASLKAQTNFVSGLYQIVSGSYSVCCGIAGAIVSPLPSDDQSFVKLVIDSQTGLASMTFLGKDTRTIYGVPSCPPNYAIQFSFPSGFRVSDYFVFHVDPGPLPNYEYWNFSVSNSAGGLRVDGTLGRAAQACADIPTQFTYSNVVAVLIPTPEIRVSAVDICWNSASNVTYQVQYQPTLTTNNWLNLGAPVVGNGLTTCVTDQIARGQTERVYRVVPLP